MRAGQAAIGTTNKLYSKQQMRLRKLLLPSLLLVLATSCNNNKTVLPYFTDIVEIKEGELPVRDYRPEIKPDDELIITVSSENPQVTSAYNLPAYIPPSASSSTGVNTQFMLETYRVDSKGDINFPQLGTIHVAGMTVEGLRDYLTKRISADVENPDVTVKLADFNVAVAGEVVKPGLVAIKGNRFTLLDALAAAGDLTPYGERNNVLLIREENGERKYVHLDLNSSETLKSPYFYLRQNDYIYVSPNKVRQSNSKYDQNNAYKLSMTSTIVSAASVLASLVIALTVK